MTEAEMLAALATGRGPDGLPVKVTATMTLRKFDGEGTEGKEPVEIVEITVVDGEPAVREG